ncbi:CDC50/LEM3 family [Polychytrium aggregatum]|uniref:CDC50/LEM3 family n=1 Tax=Polychytrium aggregatum TaxID=110093 RepID=UPI0022FE0E05|nr:CDC50/LEM3 family [Polychytrium aggregatum]KAI9197210.1 CDC50/LEM3 family [Polychytrium aggregatum]
MPEERPRLKKPANTAFKQQRLKAWQPILTPKTVLPAYFIIGAIFIPIGIALYIVSDQVNQVVFDYTNCDQGVANGGASQVALSPPLNTIDNPIIAWVYNATTNQCTIQFKISQTFSQPVFMYYRLTNFYQNHRRYVKSFDSSQLQGSQMTVSQLSSNCAPLLDASGVWAPGAQYYPCGLIANSFFSDNISNLTCVNVTGVCSNGVVLDSTRNVYGFTEQGIAWPSDAQKYGLTAWASATDAVINATLVPPPMWQLRYPKWANGYNSTNLPHLGKMERFQVWMRTAGLPTFRKIWGRNISSDLPPGIWQVTIDMEYNVATFSGTKSIVISTVSVMGGKNPFLGVAYIFVGCVCWILGIGFLARHMIKPRKLGDHTYLSWNQPAKKGQEGVERAGLMGNQQK